VAVEDHRGAENPLAILRAILGQGEVMVWAEGASRQQLDGDGITAQDRVGLAPVQSLAIWSVPPGPQALQAALERVAPQTVYLFAVDPQADDLQSFLNRLGGLVKHVLRADQGAPVFPSSAAATAQRSATVRKGLAWLEAAGYLVVRGEKDGEIIVESASPTDQGIQKRSRPAGWIFGRDGCIPGLLKHADADALVNAKSRQDVTEKS
jgi:hypothetical protein